jgi:uncharacterized membrane protein
MEHEKILTEEALSFGWGKARSNFGFFAAFLIAIGMVQLFFLGLTGLLAWKAWYLALIPLLIDGILAIVMGTAALSLSLKVNRDEKLRFTELWVGGSKASSYLIGCILYVIIVSVGFLLLIIPGIYLAIKYQFFAVCILDKDVSAVEALKMSGRITKGSWGDCFWLVVEQGIACLLGLLALGIGLFWAVPTVLVAHGYAYRSLAGELAPAMETAHPLPAAAAVPVPAE